MTNKILKRLEAEAPARGSRMDQALKGDRALAQEVRKAYRRGVPVPFIMKVIREETGFNISETAMRRWLTKDES